MLFFDLKNVFDTMKLQKFQSHFISFFFFCSETYTFRDLYLTLKMRNLSDLIELHNFHDGAILSEIIANWFESIHKIYGFNHKMCYSDRTLRGCIEKKKSEIFALPTNTDVIQLNEKIFWVEVLFVSIHGWNMIQKF